MSPEKQTSSSFCTSKKARARCPDAASRRSIYFFWAAPKSWFITEDESKRRLSVTPLWRSVKPFRGETTKLRRRSMFW